MTTTDPCAAFESLLVRAADDSLDAAEHARLDAHLSTCAACRQALADQRAVRDALVARPPLRARPEFSFAVMRAIESEREGSWLYLLDFRQWTWRLAPVAAALSLATWMVLLQFPATTTGSLETTSAYATAAAFDEELPVSAALWQESVSDVSVLSLMLRASADDKLADTYKER